MRAKYFILLIILPLSSCNLPEATATMTPAPSIPTVVLDTPISTSDMATSTASPIEEAEIPPTATPEGTLTRTQYHIQVNYVYPGTLGIEQEMVYVNTSGSTLNEIVLVLAAKPRRYDWESVYWGAPDYGLVDYQLEDGKMRIPLREPLALGENVRFNLSYGLNLGVRGMGGYDDRIANFSYWYAFVPPYDDVEGWLIHPEGRVGEHQPLDVADYEVTIRPTDPELVVAATGYEQIMDTGYHYSVKNARHFIWSASYYLTMMEREHDGIVLQSYYFPQHQAAAEHTLDVAEQALDLFEQLYGPYPHKSLTIIETYINDGLEADAGFFLDTFYYAGYAGGEQNYLTTLTAHEIAHSWFYGQVGNDPAIAPWLDETLSTYSETLYYEYYYPEQVDWWWQFRINRFGTGGWVNGKIYDHQNFETYVQAVYFRGAVFMQELRELVGDEVFFEILAEYAQSPSVQLVTAEDFFTIVEKHSDADLSDLKETYFSPWR